MVEFKVKTIIATFFELERILALYLSAPILDLLFHGGAVHHVSERIREENEALADREPTLTLLRHFRPNVNLSQYHFGAFCMLKRKFWLRVHRHENLLIWRCQVTCKYNFTALASFEMLNEKRMSHHGLIKVNQANLVFSFRRELNLAR